MKLDTMPREAALLRLIALEPCSRIGLQEACGWPCDEFEELLADIIARDCARFVIGLGGPSDSTAVIDIGPGVDNDVREFCQRARAQLREHVSFARRLERASEAHGRKSGAAVPGTVRKLAAVAGRGARP